MMRMLGTLAVLAATNLLCQAESHVPFKKYTLDEIVPSTDEATGHARCCPVGTRFVEGQGCIFGGTATFPGEIIMNHEGANAPGGRQTGNKGAQDPGDIVMNHEGTNAPGGRQTGNKGTQGPGDIVMNHEGANTPGGRQTGNKGTQDPGDIVMNHEGTNTPGGRQIVNKDTQDPGDIVMGLKINK